jgi:hypothetical protein
VVGEWLVYEDVGEFDIFGFEILDDLEYPVDIMCRE